MYIILVYIYILYIHVYVCTCTVYILIYILYIYTAVFIVHLRALIATLLKKYCSNEKSDGTFVWDTSREEAIGG